MIKLGKPEIINREIKILIFSKSKLISKKDQVETIINDLIKQIEKEENVDKMKVYFECIDSFEIDPILDIKVINFTIMILLTKNFDAHNLLITNFLKSIIKKALDNYKKYDDVEYTDLIDILILLISNCFKLRSSFSYSILELIVNFLNPALNEKNILKNHQESIYFSMKWLILVDLLKSGCNLYYLLNFLSFLKYLVYENELIKNHMQIILIRKKIELSKVIYLFLENNSQTDTPIECVINKLIEITFETKYDLKNDATFKIKNEVFLDIT